MAFFVAALVLLPVLFLTYEHVMLRMLCEYIRVLVATGKQMNSKTTSL